MASKQGSPAVVHSGTAQSWYGGEDFRRNTGGQAEAGMSRMTSKPCRHNPVCTGSPRSTDTEIISYSGFQWRGLRNKLCLPSTLPRRQGHKIWKKRSKDQLQRAEQEHMMGENRASEVLDETKEGSRDTNTGGTTTPTLPSLVSLPIAVQSTAEGHHSPKTG